MAAAPARPAAFSPPHPCVAYPVVVSDLRKCATATPFCTSYLGGPGSFTRSVIKTISVTTGETSTFTDDEYFTSSMLVTVMDPTSTVTAYESTTTTTTSQDHCPSDQPRKLKRAPEPKQTKVPASSCGIYRSAPASAISGGCNCILAHVVTSTTIYTKDIGPTDTVTQEVDHTTTDSSTVTVTPSTTLTLPGTTTVTACIQPTGCTGYRRADFDPGIPCVSENARTTFCQCHADVDNGNGICTNDSETYDGQPLCHSDTDCDITTQACVHVDGLGQQVCAGLGPTCNNF